MGVSVPVPGEVDEKLGDARRGLCLAGPGAVAPLALVFRVHPAFSKSFVAFKELEADLSAESFQCLNCPLVFPPPPVRIFYVLSRSNFKDVKTFDFLKKIF